MKKAQGTTTLSASLPLLSEVGDLKRVRAAHFEGSAAESAFRRSWASLTAGESPERVALRETAAATATARLGAIDATTLLRCGLGQDEALEALERSFDEVAATLPKGWRDRLRGSLHDASNARASVPRFVRMLERQPRAGATRPGRARLVLEPPESHADHCWAVAVYSCLLSASFGAEVGAVFLAGLAHHLHNAVLPDAGHAADVILANRINDMQCRLLEEALGELPEDLREAVSDALATTVGRVDSPEARAFQAADVLDRVLQMDQYAKVASFTLDQALGEMDLVHPGPEQEFHLEVLREAGLS